MKLEDGKIEVIFKEELNSKNKLVRFIIDKILEENYVIERMVDGDGAINGGRSSIKNSNRSI